MSFEDTLKTALQPVTNSKVKEAMLYSALAGGKRIRPTLLYEVLKGYGLNESIGDEFACAIEMIHTYSLIHDDLPAMDNDVLRRGKNTCHIEFDEATAILAGDGLLTYAFELAASSDQKSEYVVKCIKILANMSGPSGMVYGQCLDIEESSKDNDFSSLQQIHTYKTGCLLSAPLMMGAILANKEDSIVNEWHKIGNDIGLAFQIQDDIFDRTKSDVELGKSRSDLNNDKLTSVSILGLEGAKELMDRLYNQSKEKIKAMEGFDGTSLLQLIESIQNRMM